MKRNTALEWKNKGNEYYKAGEYGNALECYGKALETDPEYLDAWNNIYLTLLKLGRDDDARKCKEMLDKLTLEPAEHRKEMRILRSHHRKKITLVLVAVLIVVGLCFVWYSVK
jgi:tetratricopeptide (TPR) repeat protein